jgi:hypothetical protein
VFKKPFFRGYHFVALKTNPQQISYLFASHFQKTHRLIENFFTYLGLTEEKFEFSQMEISLENIYKNTFCGEDPPTKVIMQ